MKIINERIKWEETNVQDVLTSREAESLLKVSRDTLNRYCMNGTITYTRPTNGKRYFLKSDILNHISKNTFSASKHNRY